MFRKSKARREAHYAKAREARLLAARERERATPDQDSLADTRHAPDAWASQAPIPRYYLDADQGDANQ